jgi:acylphosphatase
MKRRVSFTVSGRVQGVGFRAFAQDEALRLGVHGWIRNLESGAVVGEVEGQASSVDAFIAWCGRGPRGARVDHLEAFDRQVLNEDGGFQILW